MAITIEHLGYTITKTGTQAWDYRCTFTENGLPRTRFGTVDELKADIELVTSGNSLPPKQRGFA